MAKYHLKENGEPGVCRAQPGKCPKAKDSEHYATKGEAQTAYEKNMEKALLTRFSKVSSASYANAQFKEKVARRRRVEDAILKADPRKIAIEADYRDLERTWDGTTKHGYYIHPEFRASLPDNEDMAAYVEIVQLEDRLSDSEKDSAYVTYNEKSGLFTYSYREARDYGPSYDDGYDD